MNMLPESFGGGRKEERTETNSCEANISVPEILQV
jgi:hypothetical protein